MSATLIKTTTADELIKLPRGEHRYQLDKGELIAMSPAGYSIS